MSQAVEPCPNCPKRPENYFASQGTIIGMGEAAIVIEENEGVSYAFINADGSRPGEGRQAFEDMANNHPSFMAALRACEGPDEAEQPRRGVLGALGLRKTEVSCPVIAAEIGEVTAENIQNYFQDDPVQQIRGLIVIQQL